MEIITNLAYLVSAVLFILGLKMLGSARTARRGNIFAALAMLIAIVVTLFRRDIITDYTFIIAGIVIGAGIGAVFARTVQMTAMPQMVALFNGFGGGASALVAMAEFLLQGSEGYDVSITLVLSLLIGTVTFTGSLIAFVKLQGLMRGAPIVLPGHQLLNVGMLIAVAVIGVLFVVNPTTVTFLILVAAIAAVLGVTFVIPIGGADMPVVISLLNSYSGIAAAMTGFVLSNNILIISGALVGASGLILTSIMCVAMNRSLTNVLFAAVGTDDGGEAVAGGEARQVTAYTPEDMAMMLDNASSMIIIPGYGLAVAQAQHVLHEVAQQAQRMGVKVRYAIHPVAGRMPGHMNVLLAEANVPYDQLFEMDAINDDFKDTDIALVVGANDVINPGARDKKNSPLYGMPILNADQARTVIVLKRSLRAGFAGEDNEIFYMDKTMMVFGDAKDTLTKLSQILKNR